MKFVIMNQPRITRKIKGAIMKEASASRWIMICASPILFFLLASQTAYADPFSFSTIPSSGTVIGGPGSTVGWGYSITNLSSTNWLEITALNAGAFLFGTPDASLFNFPILEPGATVTVTYVAGLSGLFEFTWDLTAPAGFENIGIFLLSGAFWSGDPFAGGAFLDFAEDQSAPYLARVSSPGTPVPESPTVLLLSLGLGCVFLGRAYFGQCRPSKQTLTLPRGFSF